jgi:WhiB family redox-sensing transcriptional regulator
MTEVRCWRDQAACLEVVSGDYDPFFADSAELQAEAIATCETCPVRDACLTFAVRTGQQYGIWGGQPQQIIRRLIAFERAGRPHRRRAPASHPQASKTHCKHGHRFSAENTYYAPTASAAAAGACARPNPPVPANAGQEATQMWRDRNRYDDHGLVPDTFWLLVRCCCSPPAGWCG